MEGTQVNILIFEDIQSMILEYLVVFILQYDENIMTKVGDRIQRYKELRGLLDIKYNTKCEQIARQFIESEQVTALTKYLDKIYSSQFIVNTRNLNTREKYLIECREQFLKEYGIQVPDILKQFFDFCNSKISNSINQQYDLSLKRQIQFIILECIQSVVKSQQWKHIKSVDVKIKGTSGCAIALDYMRVDHTNFPNTDLDLKIYFRPTFSEYINLDDLKYDLDYDFEFRESIQKLTNQINNTIYKTLKYNNILYNMTFLPFQLHELQIYPIYFKQNDINQAQDNIIHTYNQQEYVIGAVYESSGQKRAKYMAEILDIKYLIQDDPIFKEDISQCVNDFRKKQSYKSIDISELYSIYGLQQLSLHRIDDVKYRAQFLKQNVQIYSNLD